ncbi:MAG: hypothetical protein CLLPBCKN_001661 [Chroococcidiopsis cubana SAG 39.79]|jgi:hypothetical protein|uniref:Uncharacterized protein n=1 Tax=Chroococcidiopsis cubana SAG 39.79 TaxID=388085 RepID=A0AB37UDI6_9CYAN|nr:hypothetical protein [Chroococcidiopsis cubana]MDZ4872273.1 hypothetical protein [Chroococcidiopsis cubana SAG 39.79]PSB54764.1 hypothetical protein C7B79_34405 [Chroococcidiopsis cubana CCALA 043]RUT07417.1 hypothetical protein DSM107010_50960 [Chroococcidiopsis cubana SAG 39.79]
MGRHISKICRQCATLSVEDAKELHGENGDRCWNPRICHRRRSHYRHRDDNNRSRRRTKRIGISVSTELSVPVEIEPPVPQSAIAAVLVLYRQHKNSPVHAVAAEIWQGSHLIASVKPVHCMGMRGDRVSEYLQEILQLLTQQFGVVRFEDIIKEVPVQKCPIRPCPLQI